MTYYTRLYKIVNDLHENPSNNCLEWWGAVAGRYGQIQYKRKKWVVHRLAWELFYKKPFPSNLVAHHKCMNRICFNPLHIEPMTNYENLSQPDGIVGINKAKTHCPKGHEYNESNTRIYKGLRNCRECDRIRSVPRNELAKAKRRYLA